MPYCGALSKYLTPLTDPSFFPDASSSSTPTQSPVWNCVAPTKRTVPIRPSLSSIFCPTDSGGVLMSPVMYRVPVTGRTFDLECCSDPVRYFSLFVVWSVNTESGRREDLVDDVLMFQEATRADGHLTSLHICPTTSTLEHCYSLFMFARDWYGGCEQVDDSIQYDTSYHYQLQQSHFEAQNIPLIRSQLKSKDG